MFHDQKITRSWRVEYSAFFAANYISKLFELCFMTKKQQPGSGGLCVRLHKIVTPSEATQTGEQWCGRIPAKIFLG
jgi:hypothetical protein